MTILRRELSISIVDTVILKYRPIAFVFLLLSVRFAIVFFLF